MPRRSTLFVLLWLFSLALQAPRAIAQQAPDGSPVVGPGGHYYEVVLGNGVTWKEAQFAARSRFVLGSRGHLATITSKAEDEFIEGLRQQALQGAGIDPFARQSVETMLWVGGFQSHDEAESTRGWSWVNDEGSIPISQEPRHYNWNAGEPDDAGRTTGEEDNEENYLAIGAQGRFVWSDIGVGAEGKPLRLVGFVVEYDHCPPSVAGCVEPCTDWLSQQWACLETCKVIPGCGLWPTDFAGGLEDWLGLTAPHVEKFLAELAQLGGKVTVSAGGLSYFIALDSPDPDQAGLNLGDWELVLADENGNFPQVSLFEFAKLALDRNLSGEVGDSEGEGFVLFFPLTEAAVATIEQGARLVPALSDLTGQADLQPIGPSAGPAPLPDCLLRGDCDGGGETLPPGAIETDDFDSSIGVGNQGLWGPIGGTGELTPPASLFARCGPPDGATVLDFDADPLGVPPEFPPGHPVLQIPGTVEVPPSGTLTSPQAVDLGGPLLEVVSFREPQRYVGLVVGDTFPMSGGIELVAFDAADEVVSVDRIEHAGAYVGTCMAVRVFPEPAIRRVVLQGPPEANLWFDQLFFSDSGDLVATPRPVVGEVRFLNPLDRAELRTTMGHLVTGTIRVPTALPLDWVHLAVYRPDNSIASSRILDVNPLYEDGADTMHVFLANRVYVPPGWHSLSVSAAGPGVRAGAFIDVFGRGPELLGPSEIRERVDFEPITLEVTQAIRGPVDLIAPGTTIEERSDTVLVRDKRTVVRGFARAVAQGAVLRTSVPVNAELVGTRDGRALPGSPLAPHNGPTIELDEYSSRAAAYHSAKQDTHGSWNFRLPASWTREGSIDLQLVINTRRRRGFVPEAPGRDGALNRIGLRNVTFRSQQWPNVRIWSVDYWWRCGEHRGIGGVRFPNTHPNDVCARSPGFIRNMKPTDAQILQSVRGWWNISPFPGSMPRTFRIFDYVFADAGDPPEPHLEEGSTIDQIGLGIAFRGDLFSNHDYSTFNAVVSSFVRGRAQGVPSTFRATADPGGEVLAHEACHTMGLRHTGGGHGEGFPIARWSADHGEIARDRESVSAFNVAAMQALPYRRAGDGVVLHDLMSYGGRRWPSWEVWHHMEDVVGSNLVRIDNRLDNAHYGAPADDTEDTVAVVGHLRADGVELAPAFARDLAILGDGDLLLEVLDAKGNVLAEATSYSFVLHDSDDDTRAFIVPLEIGPQAAELVIYRDGKEIDRSSVSPAPQAVVLSAPTAWPRQGLVEVSWTVAGGNPLRYRLEARRGEEGGWQELANTTETSVTLDVRSLPVEGEGWQLRVQASSGLAATSSQILGVDFPPRPLEPMILSPLDGEIFSKHTVIPLQASVPEHPGDDIQSLRWTLDGELVSTGPEGMAYTADPGTHEIALTVPGTQFTTSVEILVVEDADVDGLPDDWELQNGLSPEDPEDPSDDIDEDGLAAWEEHEIGTSPTLADTDDDGYSDTVERESSSDPTDPLSVPLPSDEPPRFLRGDVNDDGEVNIADAVATLDSLFLSRSSFGCRAAANSNADDGVDIGDPLYTLLYLFAGGTALAEPFPVCDVSGVEEDRELGCVTPPRNCP